MERVEPLADMIFQIFVTPSFLYQQTALDESAVAVLPLLA